MERSYSEVLQWLYSQLPMYQRVGKAAYKADLSTTQKLMALGGNPENKIKALHVAGTNGKGSVSHLCASVLQEAGYKVGLYTSPHLKDFRERIKVNGEMIPETMVMQFVEHYEESFKDIQPSFFEMTVLLAFEYFVYSNVDIAVVEVGMGGRLDSTNVLTPEVSVITNIGMDHQQFLGDTIEAIAAEKAGIIKNEVPVVLGAMKEEAFRKIESIAIANQSNLKSTEKEQFDAPVSQLKGHYQRENERTAWLALYELKQKGWPIEKQHVERGFERVVDNTGLLGRWQTISESPKTIADCGHNEDGIAAILEALKEETFEELHIVIGLVSDKDLDKVLSM